MDTYVQEGYIISPMADFFSPASKNWIGLTIQADNIGAGNTMELYVATDPDALLVPSSGAWTFVTRLVIAAEVGNEIVLPAIEGRYAAVQIRLQTTAASTETPKLISYALRAFADSEDFIVQMPVSLSDQIERPNRRPIRLPGYGEAIFNALLGYDGAYVTLDLFRPALTFRGIVEQIQTPIVSQHLRGSRTLYSLVRLRGQIIASGQEQQETFGTLGVAQLGVQQLGT